MNAYDKLAAAEREYLEASGWKSMGDGIWQEPAGRKLYPRRLPLGHAVNSQKFYERTPKPNDACSKMGHDYDPSAGNTQCERCGARAGDGT